MSRTYSLTSRPARYVHKIFAYGYAFHSVSACIYMLVNSWSLGTGGRSTWIYLNEYAVIFFVCPHVLLRGTLWWMANRTVDGLTLVREQQVRGQAGCVVGLQVATCIIVTWRGQPFVVNKYYC